MFATRWINKCFKWWNITSIWWWNSSLCIWTNKLVILYYIEKKLNEAVRFRELPIDDCVIFDDETRNESTIVLLKTWFLGNECRSCFLDREEQWRVIGRRWGLEFDESLLKYIKI